ncbi:MAG: helix-turn-helix domain-containing protein [Propionibacteriaceae bacterium]|nr:helix-turn-helix domain-containing protein [Propionibacteriaceae bacterium]
MSERQHYTFPPTDLLHSYEMDEVAARLCLSRRSIQRLIEKGRLTPLHERRRGTPIRITAKSLQAYFDAAEEAASR